MMSKKNIAMSSKTKGKRDSVLAPVRASKRLKIINKEPTSSPKTGTARSRQRTTVRGRSTLVDLENNVVIKQEKSNEEPECEGKPNVYANSVNKESRKRCMKKENVMKPSPKKYEAESDSLDSSDEEDEINEYEKLRQRNIKGNMEFLAQLGMNQAKSDLIEVTLLPKKKQASSRGYKEKKDKEIIPRRQPSLRLQRKDPAGQDVPYVPPADIIERRDPERKTGSLEFHDVLKNNENVEESGNQFISYLQKMKQKYARPTPLQSDLDKFVKGLNKLKLAEQTVAKVCPARIFSLAFHPTTDRVLLAAGDKEGHVGFWDVASSEGQDGVFCFAPHTRPVSNLAFSHFNSSHLFTASYDGSLRCGDLNKAVFDEVYVYPEEDSNVSVLGFDFFTADTMVATTTDGYMVFIDRRTRSTKGESEYEVHPKKRVRTVCVHPVQKQYFATAGSDNCVKIWDNRKISVGKKPSPVCTLTHGKMVNSAYFSSVTGNKLLTTSMDNTLRIYDTTTIDASIRSTCSIRHNNHTGRWLSKFNAAWHPARDDMFIVGSMNRPRQIEVYSDKGTVVKVFKDEDWLGSVCSLNAFHPSQDIVAGGNSSGRVHVFM